jgi:hypothetical protein
MDFDILREEFYQALCEACAEFPKIREFAMKARQLGYLPELDPNVLRGSIIFSRDPKRPFPDEKEKRAFEDHNQLRRWIGEMNLQVDEVLVPALDALQEKIRDAGFDPKIEVNARLSLEKDGAPIAIDEEIEHLSARFTKSPSGKPN